MTAPALPAPAARARLEGNLAAVAGTVAWSAGFPAAEALLATWPPAWVVAGRLAMALLLLWPALLLAEGWPRGIAWGRGLAAGALGLGGGAYLLIWAQRATDPVTVAVVTCASPLLATLVEWVAERRPLPAGFVLGLGASVLGGVVASAGGEAGGGALLWGAALTLVSCLLYAWATDRSVRAFPGRSALCRTTVSISGAAILCGAAAALPWAAGGEAPPAAAGWADAGLLAVYGMGGMALSQVLLVRATSRIGVALASFHLNAAPFYVMLMLWAMGGGWSWLQALGAAVVGAGVVLAQRPARP